MALAKRRRLRHLGYCAALFPLLAIPVLLNWYQPEWNTLLKALPFFGNSSNLLRWFAAYLLPASLAAALALDAIASSNLRPIIATAGILCVLATNALTGRAYYGPNDQGIYQVATIESAWRAAARVHTGPRITGIRVLTDQQGRIIMAPNREDAFTFGYSQLLCYEPLFGYGLERFPLGLLHTGAALASQAGVLNVKNPACYVFPGANGCAPGDPFPAARAADAQAFLDYAPFPFKRPIWDWLANGLNLIAAFTLGGAAIATAGSRMLQTSHAIALLPHRAPRIMLWPNAARRKIASVFATGQPRKVALEEPAYPKPSPPRPDGLIEIVLPSGIIIRVDAQVDEAALRRVLGALQQPPTPLT